MKIRAYDDWANQQIVIGVYGFSIDMRLVEAKSLRNSLTKAICDYEHLEEGLDEVCGQHDLIIPEHEMKTKHKHTRKL